MVGYIVLILNSKIRNITDRSNNYEPVTVAIWRILMLPVITFIPTIKNVFGIGGSCYPGIPVTCRNIGSSKS